MSAGTIQPADLTRARLLAMAETQDRARACDPSSPAARLAEALLDPLVSALIVRLIRDALAQDREAQIARAQLEAEERARAQGPPQNFQRASSRTSWVGQRAAALRAEGAS